MRIFLLFRIANTGKALIAFLLLAHLIFAPAIAQDFPKLNIGAYAMGSAQGQITSTGSSAGFYFFRRNATTASAITGAAGDVYAWYNENGNAALWTDQKGDLLTIKKDGFVGVGTTTPLDRLHIFGDVSIHAAGSNTPSYLNFKRVTDGWNAGRIGHSYSNVGYGGHLVFETNASASLTNLVERMRITYDGKIGIGTNNPISLLHLDPKGYGGLRIGNQNTGSGGYTNLYLGITQETNGYAEISSINSAGNYYGFIALNPGSGNVLIGKNSQSNNNYRLDVAGPIRANEIVVNTTGADFVFKHNYSLRPLSDLESYIKQHNHLPEIPSAAEMQAEGMKVGDLQTKLLQKIEELTLYMIELKKENTYIIEKNKQLEEKLNQIEKKQK